VCKRPLSVLQERSKAHPDRDTLLGRPQFGQNSHDIRSIIDRDDESPLTRYSGQFSGDELPALKKSVDESFDWLLQ
jgi:hypothetical protein